MKNTYSNIYECMICKYHTYNKKDYKKHIKTIKHRTIATQTCFIDVDMNIMNIMNTNMDMNMDMNINMNINNSYAFECDCGKMYKHRQSLYKHRQKCGYMINSTTMTTKTTTNATLDIVDIDIDVDDTKHQPITKELVLQLIHQNQKLQEMIYEQHNKMYEIAKEGKTITNNNTTNNQFNLNVFLNEQCKDALNLMDFVESLNVKLKDLEYTATTGYAEGISNIFINALSDLNVHKRPIHCSDSKREILYIKDNGKWQKEDDDKSKLTNAIKIIGNKSIKQISEWQKAYPDFNDPLSKQNDKYMKMLCNAMSGSTKEESDRNYDKIIRKITKEVVINKPLI